MDTIGNNKNTQNRGNRLVNEKSPYLLQHAYNPVDWHPWDETAINKARAENKPIILSVGYSTCHWCHVMEKESFEDEKIAEIMNRYFVSIKVDREERPDLDMIYMSAVTTMTGSGGWPLNVFLTPDLKPFFGGTYFPALSNYQIISWPDLLLRIAQMWQDPNEKQKILKAGDSLMERLGAYLSKPAGNLENEKPISLEPLDLAYSQYVASYDEAYGGFGKAPKFPSPTIPNFLFAYGHERKDENQKKAVSMAVNTLEAMAHGGIYDHLGGGFHRYATDAKWHVPHFEKMLYDNAQLIMNYLEAYQITENPSFAKIVSETADYVIRDMTHEKGGFFSAEDADSIPVGLSKKGTKKQEKIEGAFYVWEKWEIRKILDDSDVALSAVSNHFNIAEKGNVAEDPHGYFRNKNILHISLNKMENNLQSKPHPPGFEENVDAAKAKMFKARNLRERPHLDDKIITSWNGLMISALSKAHQVLNDENYLKAARKAASFIQMHLYDPLTRRLYRRWRQGEKKISGLSEDYAYLIQGLLDLYASDFDLKRLDWAMDLMKTQIDQFYDKDQGGFFMTPKAHDPHLIMRVKEENDNVIPSANAVSAMNLIRLSRIYDVPEFNQLAMETIQCFYSKMEQFPSSMPQMLVAVKLLMSKPVHLVIMGNIEAKNTQAMLKDIRLKYLPAITVMQFDSDTAPETEQMPSYLLEMKADVKMPTAYLCSNYSCQSPIVKPEDLKSAINSLTF